MLFDLGRVWAFGVPAVGDLIASEILARLREDAAPPRVADGGGAFEAAGQRRPASLP